MTIKLQPVPRVLLTFTDQDNPDEWETLCAVVRNYAREAVLRDRAAVPGSERQPLSDGRILGVWPDSGMPHKLIEFARCVEAAHGIGVKGRRSEWRCMKESKK